MFDRVVVITGGNSGVGKEAAVRLAEWGATVVIGARSELRGTRARAEIERRARSDRVVFLPLDLADSASIRTFADEVSSRYDRVDALVNNAGAIISDRRVTRDGFEMTFGVNHLGHHLLTSLLLERLERTARGNGRSSRVVNVASVAHRGGVLHFDDLQFERRPYSGTAAYNQSKLANVVFTLELARRCDPALVTANCCHPGPVRTGFGADGDTTGFERFGLMIGRPFMITPRWGARPLVYLASAPELDGVTGGYHVGGYLGRCARHRPSRRARDPRAGPLLWTISEELIADAQRRRERTTDPDAG